MTFEKYGIFILFFFQGSESESITIGKFGHYFVLFIGNERPGIVAVYTIDERLDTVTPVFQTMLTGVRDTTGTWGSLYEQRKVSMLDPEDMRLV